MCIPIFFKALPKITKRPPSVLVTKEGDNVVIPSKASGFPKPKISWYKDNKKVDERFYATGALRINNVKFEDHGVYLLKAKNFIGQATAKMKLVLNGNVNQRKTIQLCVSCVFRGTCLFQRN